MKSQQINAIQQQTLSKYNYVKEKPWISANNYTVHFGTNKESNLPVTIRQLKYPHVQLGNYLKKLKQCKSQNVIKIYELIVEQSFIIAVTEQTYAGVTLKKALEKCKYIDQPDAIFISKQLLNGHMDLLRLQTNWFGTEDDIEFAQDGQIRLSWNNGCSYNLVNPFPVIISKFSNRLIQDDGPSSAILPFPISKTLEQLIRLTRQNAAQISLNPQMKKKQKIAKKKGKDWVGLKQIKNKNQYFDEFTYFAIHSQHGFIRVKIFDQGKISPNLLQLNKTKLSFTRIHEVYQQNLKTIITSQYSNDGNLQSYVLRLKTAGVKLKQDQIQFFVYSLLEPIKQVQLSTLKSISMLNIRNIYIEFGIPKIGQPIPMNEKIEQVLIDRKQVPDFYHPQFKQQPSDRQEKFDTYSLGVLLYKLMYTQMPIFPQPNKVHIPTAPAFNKRLKQSVQLFLTQGKSIREIEQKIEMSESVKKQIQQNKQRLKKSKDQNKLSIQVQQKNPQNSDQQPQQEVVQQSSSQDENGVRKHQQEVDSDDDEDGPGCWQTFMKKITLRERKKMSEEKRKLWVDQLEVSTFKNFRIWSKCVVIFILYTFLFYYQFIQNSILMLQEQSLLTKVDLSLQNNSTNVSIITTDRYIFQSSFNKTGKSLVQLQKMNCLIQDPLSAGLKYSSFLKQDSQWWFGYVFGGLGSMLLIFLLKGIQLHTFDDINALHRRQQAQGHFNRWNWVLVNFHWLGLISGHYFLFNFIFRRQTQPCVGHKNGYVWGSTDALFNDHDKFISPYVIVFALQIFFCALYLILIQKNFDYMQKYNKILNTITIFGSVLAIFWLIIRLGILMKTSYYPAATTDTFGIITNLWSRNSDYILFFAILPQALFAGQLIFICIINWIYYTFFDKLQKLQKTEMALIDASLHAIL